MLAWLRRGEQVEAAPRRSRLTRDLIARSFQGAMQRRHTGPRPPLKNLNDVLVCIEDACAHAETVSCRAILDEIGQRSFGAVLLLPALVVVSPLSGIIGLPTMAAALIIAISAQMLLGRKEFWVPVAVSNRSMPCMRLHQALRFLRPVARATDWLLRPRMSAVTQGAGTRAIAACCILLALLIPPLELVPFASTLVAGVVTLFGLALLSNDGAVALVAYVLTALALGAAASLLLAPPAIL